MEAEAGMLVEDEEIGKIGRWAIPRCELNLQFTRALGRELSDIETAIVVNG